VASRGKSWEAQAPPHSVPRSGIRALSSSKNDNCTHSRCFNSNPYNSRGVGAVSLIL